MKYTVRHVRKFLEQGRIDPALWKKRFPTLLDSKVPCCSDCEDQKRNLCEGGKDPVDCLLALTSAAGTTDGSEEPAKKKNRSLQWSPSGKERVIPHGVNKPYDQSKI
jgi:hypothetical protein